MLTAIQIVYVFITLQLESNSTGTTLNWTDVSQGGPWSFIFSLAAAIGSIATLGALYFIWKQSKLTRDQISQNQQGIDLTKQQISQTQQEIDSTLRPWIGHTSYKLDRETLDQDRQAGPKDIAKIDLKNYGRLPARLTRQVQLWQLTEIKEEDLAKQPETKADPIMIFPDQMSPYSFVGEESLIYRKSDFYFGFLLWYDAHVGQRTKEGKYGIILKCKSLIGHVIEYNVVNTFAG